MRWIAVWRRNFLVWRKLVIASVLSNLALSYLLSKDLPRAEEILRRAYGRADADPRVRQNLALVVGLRGHLAEAEGIMKEGLPPEEASASIAGLRRMLIKRANARDADNTASIGVARPQ